MTPNTRLQRFEVLKNGTFVIRGVQVQDRGQYMCTAKNLHGADRRVVLLSVTVQQPQILASRSAPSSQCRSRTCRGDRRGSGASLLVTQGAQDSLTHCGKPWGGQKWVFEPK